MKLPFAPDVPVPSWRDLPLEAVRRTFPIRDKRVAHDELTRERIQALVTAVETTRIQLAALTAQLEDALSELRREGPI